MSEFETAGYLEQLQSLGLDVVNNVKIQNNVHNKGIVVDTQSVLISSQNWSTDGTLYNRDAGVIIESAAAAQYFEQIFLHDWEHLASRRPNRTEPRAGPTPRAATGQIQNRTRRRRFAARPSGRPLKLSGPDRGRGEHTCGLPDAPCCHYSR